MTGQPLSYILKTAEGDVIFHGGDTSISYDLKLYGELHRPHIGLLGVGGAIIGGRPVVEMNPSEAALAAQFLGVKIAIPMHYVEKERAENFVRELKVQAPKAKGLILKPGETFRYQAK